jgi:hypothetical protein
VRLVVGLCLFDTWVILEEGVVDRTGLWELSSSAPSDHLAARRARASKMPYPPLINFTPPRTPFPFSMDGGNPNISRKAWCECA